MAVRLGEHVVCGELSNTSHYGVCGWIRLRGRESPILLHLTGNCDADLAGRHFRFEARGADEMAGDEAAEEDDEFSFLANQQIGPTGTMTAARRVKVTDCPGGELYLRSKMDEPPPMEWKPCLYLEWFSQNGRVLVELPDPVIEFVQEEPAAESPGDSEAVAASGEIDPVPYGDEGNADDLDWLDAAEGFDETEEEDDDPYGLFPDGLLNQFDLDAAEVDRGLDDDPAQSRAMYEMELMDDLIAGSDGVPLDEIFDGPLKLPRPDQLADDAEAESALKTLLAQLALFGIALDVCEHFTPRDAYRLLLEEICPEQTAYPELRNTQWVQHFMTGEFCPQCEAEFDREFDETHGKENPEPDSPGECDGHEDGPF